MAMPVGVSCTCAHCSCRAGDAQHARFPCFHPWPGSAEGRIQHANRGVVGVFTLVVWLGWEAPVVVSAVGWRVARSTATTHTHAHTQHTHTTPSVRLLGFQMRNSRLADCGCNRRLPFRVPPPPHPTPAWKQTDVLALPSRGFSTNFCQTEKTDWRTCREDVIREWIEHNDRLRRVITRDLGTECTLPTTPSSSAAPGEPR